MSKIIIPEFDICHKFVNEIRHVFSTQFGKFAMTHNVSDTDFTIFIEYSPGLFDIDSITTYIQDAAIKSDLSTYNWNVHRPMIYKMDAQQFSDNDFKKEVVSNFSVI